MNNDMNFFLVDVGLISQCKIACKNTFINRSSMNQNATYQYSLVTIPLLEYATFLLSLSDKTTLIVLDGSHLRLLVNNDCYLRKARLHTFLVVSLDMYNSKKEFKDIHFGSIKPKLRYAQMSRTTGCPLR